MKEVFPESWELRTDVFDKSTDVMDRFSDFLDLKAQDYDQRILKLNRNWSDRQISGISHKLHYKIRGRAKAQDRWQTMTMRTNNIPARNMGRQHRANDRFTTIHNIRFNLEWLPKIANSNAINQCIAMSCKVYKDSPVN